MSKFFLADKSETAIKYSFAVAILGNSREPIFTVTGQSPEACLQPEGGDGAQLHVSTKGRKPEE